MTAKNLTNQKNELEHELHSSKNQTMSSPIEHNSKNTPLKTISGKIITANTNNIPRIFKGGFEYEFKITPQYIRNPITNKIIATIENQELYIKKDADGHPVMAPFNVSTDNHLFRDISGNLYTLKQQISTIYGFLGLKKWTESKEYLQPIKAQ